MHNRLLFMPVLFTTLLFTTKVLLANDSAIAQTPVPIPQADQAGDYDRNETPIQGPVPPNSKLVPGSLWQVVRSGLNCRRKPGATQPLLRQFKFGDILQAEVSRGGSDEVFSNARDTTGKPWMWVRAKSFKLEDACYVRANRRYIRPVTKTPSGLSN